MYRRLKAPVKMNWVAITLPLNKGPGLRSARKVIRCILSFSASSIKVWIQPWSLCILKSNI